MEPPGGAPRTDDRAVRTSRNDGAGAQYRMIWLAFSLGVIVSIACLWWFAWQRRDRKPPTPRQPHREWKD